MFKKRERHPVARVRAVVAGADLFFPNKSKRSKRRKVKKILRRIITNPKAVEKNLPWNAKAGVGPGFAGRSYFFLRKTVAKDKTVILHEFAHFFMLGKNDLLTANSLQGYFEYVSGEFLPRRQAISSYLRDAEDIAKHGYDRFRPELRMDRAGLLPTKESIAPVGFHLGAFAAQKEAHWKKPASGLFLIREICNGVPVRKAVQKIESGELDAEIAAFAKKHLKNLLS